MALTKGKEVSGAASAAPFFHPARAIALDLLPVSGERSTGSDPGKKGMSG